MPALKVVFALFTSQVKENELHFLPYSDFWFLPCSNPWYICRVTMTYQDIFHRKHASIYDLAFQQRWQVVALIDDIKNDLGDLAE
jgi:hypothetical protein